MIPLGDIDVKRVDNLSEHAERVPSDEADWAGMTSSTQLELRDESMFEACGIAVVGDPYTHNYQAKTSVRIRDIQKMQQNLGWFKEEEKNKDGIIERTNDSREKYTLYGMIRSLAFAILTDGRRNGNPSKDNLTVEYTDHDTLDEYIVLIKWS